MVSITTAAEQNNLYSIKSNSENQTETSVQKFTAEKQGESELLGNVYDADDAGFEDALDYSIIHKKHSIDQNHKSNEVNYEVDTKDLQNIIDQNQVNSYLDTKSRENVSPKLESNVKNNKGYKEILLKIFMY